ncbi:hypothetical protein ES703_123200 [subsurface metagenome]
MTSYCLYQLTAGDARSRVQSQGITFSDSSSVANSVSNQSSILRAMLHQNTKQVSFNLTHSYIEIDSHVSKIRIYNASYST